MAALGCVLAMGSVVFAMAIDLKIGIYFLCVEAVVMGVVIHFALRSVKKSRISLNDDQSGYTSCDLDISLIGKEARVSKDLKPAGFIEIDGVEFQALSKGGYLKKDQIVRIHERTTFIADLVQKLITERNKENKEIDLSELEGVLPNFKQSSNKKLTTQTLSVEFIQAL